LPIAAAPSILISSGGMVRTASSASTFTSAGMSTALQASEPAAEHGHNRVRFIGGRRRISRYMIS
jgi:hypothetical protein